MSWQEAIHLLTDVPARLYGLKHRGRVAEGWWADLVVFDPATVGHGPERRRDDMPGGGSRLYAEGTGIEHVLVNGSEIVRHGTFTGTLDAADDHKDSIAALRAIGNAAACARPRGYGTHNYLRRCRRNRDRTNGNDVQSRRTPRKWPVRRAFEDVSF